MPPLRNIEATDSPSLREAALKVCISLGDSRTGKILLRLRYLGFGGCPISFVVNVYTFTPGVKFDLFPIGSSSFSSAGESLP
jgi:hypothetical protein